MLDIQRGPTNLGRPTQGSCIIIAHNQNLFGEPSRVQCLRYFKESSMETIAHQGASFGMGSSQIQIVAKPRRLLGD